MHNNKGGDEEKTEPKENDKWMENNEHDKDSEVNPKISRLEELRGRAKQLASNKYHLVIVLLCVILFILFLIVLILAVQLGTYACPEKNECQTPECLRASSLVLARADFTHEPCNDFWAFSCKGWISENPIPSNKGSYSVSDQLKENLYTRIRHVIDLVPHDADTSTHQWKVKSFYDICRDMHQVEYRFPDKLNQAIQDLGGWAMTKYPPTSKWNRNEVLINLQVQFGVPVFFSVHVEPNDLNPLENIIKLVPDGLGLPNRDYYFKPLDDTYVKAYKEFIRDMMKEMGAGLREANRFANEMFHYEQRIAEVTPSPQELRNTKDLYVILTVRELDRLSSSITWLNVLQEMFPNFVQLETKIAILSEDYFRDISRIISSSDEVVLNNYYMWRFMHAYLPHSSAKYRLVANYFKQSFEGVPDLNIDFQDHWESCIDVMMKYVGHAVGAMYVSHYFPQESQDQVNKYLHKLAGSFSSLTNQIPWMSSADVESALSKVRSLVILSGNPGFVKNNTMDSYYKNLRLTTDFFMNIKNGALFVHRKQEEMLQNSATADHSWSLYPTDIKSEYKYSGNQLIVPAGLFASPLYDLKAPLAVKYGVLAAYVANKLVEAFDDKGINYDEYGALNQWLSNNSLSAFSSKKKCLKTLISNYSIHDIPVNADLTIASFIADVGGVKLAYAAYKRHAAEEHVGELPSVDLNNAQLFFMSYVQAQCQVIRHDKLGSTRDSNPELPTELRVRATLQQLPEFSDAFSCSAGSVMNSKKHCYMW